VHRQAVLRDRQRRGGADAWIPVGARGGLTVLEEHADFASFRCCRAFLRACSQQACARGTSVRPNFARVASRET